MSRADTHTHTHSGMHARWWPLEGGGWRVARVERAHASRPHRTRFFFFAFSRLLLLVSLSLFPAKRAAMQARLDAATEAVEALQNRELL